MQKLKFLIKNNNANTVFELLNCILQLSSSTKVQPDANKISLRIGTSIIFASSDKQVLLLLRDDIKSEPAHKRRYSLPTSDHIVA